MFKVDYGSTKTKSEIVTFSDHNPSFDYVVDSEMDPTRTLADQDDDDLGSFFSRPIKIQSYSWVPGTLYENFNPWTDYFTNKRVINRLTNFNLLRARLCVKFLVNGNPFYYGRAIASYLPLQNQDSFTRTRELVGQDIISASQRPHVYLDPTTCQGGVMCLPFVWIYDSMSIPDQDWTRMGEINLREMNALQHVNGTADPITISVFAWAEDVTVSVPTSTDPGALSPQMGEIDEYGTGPVSRPASTIARTAGMLKNIPAIGPFARATEIGASAVSAVAQVFGYSRPVELEPIHYYRPRPTGNMANANYPDTSTKLTVDAKQELSIDPRIVGLGSDDEMELKSIATRESFLTTTGWQLSDPPETVIAEFEVTPFLWDTFPTPTEPEVHMTPSAFAALPFRNWRGSMKFRFQVISSAFHKGRFKIVYDPYGFASDEYNTNYTTIVDIAENKDTTVTVGWGSPRGYLQVPSFQLTGQSPTNLLFNNVGPLGTAGGGVSNGRIRIYVVNELTNPNPFYGNNVDINVFVSAGDDIEFRNPSEYLTQYSWFRSPDPPAAAAFKPQMADTEMNSDPAAAPVSSGPDMTMLQSLSTSDQSSLVYFGEEIKSFRQLLKRYNFHANYYFATGTTNSYHQYSILQSRFPAYRGVTPGSNMANVTFPNTTTSEYNPVTMTMMNYVTPAFLTRRGGIRWKCVSLSRSDIPHTLLVGERRANVNTPIFQQSSTLIAETLDGFMGDLTQITPSLMPGGEVSTLSQIPVVEVEAPMQSNARFLNAKIADFTGLLAFDDQLQFTSIGTDIANYPNALRTYVAAAEDFSLSGFMGVPIIYSNVAQPTIDSLVT